MLLLFFVILLHKSYKTMNRLKYTAILLLAVATAANCFAEQTDKGKALRLSLQKQELPYGKDVNFVTGDNAATYRYFIDFAAKHGIAYIITDKTALPDDVVEYGKGKGVGIITGQKHKVAKAASGTIAAQMAGEVQCESGIRELPSGIMEYKNNAECLDFIAKTPCEWDETVNLDADGATAMARRSGDEWYIAVINNSGKKPMTLSLPLDFLPEGEFTVISFSDGANAARQKADSRRNKDFRTSADVLDIALAPNGGFCAKLSPGHILNVKNEWGMRYAEDNKRVKALPASQRRVVFIGNSITEGWPKAHPGFFTDNGFIGRGISGQTSYEIFTRFRADVIDLAPEAVVINAGTNDIAENGRNYNEDRTFGHIQSMVELALVHGIKPILATVLPSAGFSWNREINDAPQRIASLNKRLKAYADEKGLPFIDYYSALVEKPSEALDNRYTKDGVHPTADGYTVMESVALPVITKVLSDD